MGGGEREKEGDVTGEGKEEQEEAEEGKAGKETQAWKRKREGVNQFRSGCVV